MKTRVSIRSIISALSGGNYACIYDGMNATRTHEVITSSIFSTADLQYVFTGLSSSSILAYSIREIWLNECKARGFAPAFSSNKIRPTRPPAAILAWSPLGCPLVNQISAHQGQWKRGVSPSVPTALTLTFGWRIKAMKHSPLEPEAKTMISHSNHHCCFFLILVKSNPSTDSRYSRMSLSPRTSASRIRKLFL